MKEKKYKELASKIDKLQKEIDKKVKQYGDAQKRYHGDNAISHRLEGEIDGLELQIKKLKEGVFVE